MLFPHVIAALLVGGIAGYTQAQPATPSPDLVLRTVRYELDAGSVPAQVAVAPSADDRVFALSQIWAEARFNFAYFEDLPATRWDTLYRRYLAEVRGAATLPRYYRVLERFTAELHDGHSGVFAADAALRQMLFDTPRVRLDLAEGRPFISDIASDLRDSVPVGSEIISVDGLPVQIVLRDSVLPRVAASTVHGRRWLAATRLLEGASGSQVVVELERPAGERSRVTLVRDILRATAVQWTRFPAGPASFRWLDRPGGTAYLALNSFGNPRVLALVDSVWPEVSRAAALVVDLRRNGGGSSDLFVPILERLISGTLVAPRVEARVNNSARRAWARQGWSDYAAYADAAVTVLESPRWTTRAPWTGTRLAVPTALLVGPNTASAAESFVMFAKSSGQHFVVVGEPSFGSSGQPLVFEVAGGVGVRICAVRELWPDGRRFVGEGILPDVTVAPTLADVRAARDPVLREAQAVLAQRLGH